MVANPSGNLSGALVELHGEPLREPKGTSSKTLRKPLNDNGNLQGNPNGNLSGNPRGETYEETQGNHKENPKQPGKTTHHSITAILIRFGQEREREREEIFW